MMKTRTSVLVLLALLLSSWAGTAHSHGLDGSTHDCPGCASSSTVGDIALTVDADGSFVDVGGTWAPSLRLVRSRDASTPGPRAPPVSL